MNSLTRLLGTTSSSVAWLIIGLTGLVAPAVGITLFARSVAPLQLVSVAGPILALGMMATAMIAAAAAGRVWIGLVLAVAIGALLTVFARAWGMAPVLHPLLLLLVIVIAGGSFAARGALFARSASDKGWWIAVAVVAGEAAILATAYAMPGALPGWLLALLPAQWASTAIQTALTGTGARAAIPVLVALAGTAAATLLVAGLWPRRWPYLIMFTVWLASSALVWSQSAG